MITFALLFVRLMSDCLKCRQRIEAEIPLRTLLAAALYQRALA
jgi:hypothetical protein